MGTQRKYRRQDLDGAVRLARDAVKCLEVGARTKDAELLERAAAGLQEAGKMATRQAAKLSGSEDGEPVPSP